MASWRWGDIGSLDSKSYTCGYCGKSIASALGWCALRANNPVASIYVCHHCNSPTFFGPDRVQTPGVVFGNPVEDISDLSVRDLYEEARNATGKGCYTAAVLCCRKLLMHISVAKGAKEGQSFVSYVEFLSDNHYVPPDAKQWVDQIRRTGNEANHEIVIMEEGTAKHLLAFAEMLLKLIYEFPAATKKM